MRELSKSPAIRQAQVYLRHHGPDAWLIYDYRGSNPLFLQMTGPVHHLTRPCWLLVPARGKPRLLIHNVDAGRFAAAGLHGTVFTTQRGMVAALRRLLRGKRSVAMEYSPNAALPRVSLVDAGTVELVRGLGVGVVSSADLGQYALLRWTPEQLASHRSAATKLTQVVQEAYRYIGLNLIAEVTEYDVAEFIRRRFRDLGLVADAGPIVGVNAKASEPHYEPLPGGLPSAQGDWVLIDLWAKEQSEGAIYADITWVGYVGTQVPAGPQQAFQVIVGARDAGLVYIARAHAAGRTVQGWQVDRHVRRFIARSGYGRWFTHRLGHSLGLTVHGDAANLDDLETHDTRSLLPGTGFTIEPGVYLPDFGVRSEINAYLSDGGLEVTTPPQREVVLIGQG